MEENPTIYNRLVAPAASADPAVASAVARDSAETGEPVEAETATVDDAGALTEFLFYDNAGQKFRCKLDSATGRWHDEPLDGRRSCPALAPYPTASARERCLHYHRHAESTHVQTSPSAEPEPSRSLALWSGALPPRRKRA